MNNEDYLNPGTIITLTGKTQKGKSRINQHGKSWKIKKRQEKVGFSDKHGWIYVESEKTGDCRWVCTHGKDINFIIEIDSIPLTVDNCLMVRNMEENHEYLLRMV